MPRSIPSSSKDVKEHAIAGIPYNPASLAAPIVPLWQESWERFGPKLTPETTNEGTIPGSTFSRPPSRATIIVSHGVPSREKR